MAQNVKKNQFEQKKILSVCRSVGLLVGSITFEGIELFTSNLVHRWASIRKRFGLFLRQIGSGEGGEIDGCLEKNEICRK